MVEFGKRLEDECNQHGIDWQNHCIDYNELKNIIHEAKQSIKNSKPTHKNSRSRTISFDARYGMNTNDYYQSEPRLGYREEDTAVPSTDIVCEQTLLSSLQFRYALDREIEKAVLFVLQEQGTIALELDTLAIRRAKYADKTYILETNVNQGNKMLKNIIDESINELQHIYEGYVTASRLVLRFVAFVDLNVTAVRKILKKHDKVIKYKLSHTYLSNRNSHLEQLFNDGGLSSLVDTLRRAFAELYDIECSLLPLKQKGEQQKKRHRRNRTDTGLLLTGQQHHERTNTTELSSSLRGLRGSQTTVTSKNEPLLQLIQLSRDKLKQNTKYVDIVAAQALIDDYSDEESIPGQQVDLMTNAQKLSSWLNLVSIFLYMTNYYICAPTAGQYATRVGSSDSMLGIIIGMTPNAALVATVLYGFWSNYSYKSALIFAVVCSILGNVFYAMALSYDSIHLIMLGRLFNGFGSARSINRRFIADTFSKRDRTAASAAFVTAAALGMSCGPALAAFLSKLTYSPDDKVWAEETAPGWVMLVMWTMFLIPLVVFFEEPDRKHIFGEISTSLELTAKSGSGGESTYLLAKPGDREDKSDPPIWKNVPVMMTLLVYFVLKLVLECLLSSCPTITAYYFGWKSTNSGMFLAFLGLLMFPANIVVARLSHRYEDRELIYASLIVMTCSIIGFIAFLGKYSVVQYMLFGICIFISTNALEGPNMALLSKSIPKSFAKGIFNTGFLATEAGTLARSVGDVLITLAHEVSGVSGMLDATFLPLLVLSLVSVLLTRHNYNEMIEDDDEEDGKSD